MSRSRTVALLTVAGLLAAVWVGSAFSQQRAPGRAPGQWDPEQMHERIMARIKGALGATDAEWETLGPKVEEVLTLSRQVGGGVNMGLLLRGPVPRGPRPEGAPELTELEEATDALQAVVSDEGAEAGAIKATLAAFRQARKEAGEELAEARAELRKLVTPRQEGHLVLFGLLD